MIISDKNKFIFIHNPKTAGESIEAALKPYASLIVSAPKNLHRTLNKHSSPMEIRKYIGNKRWKSYFKFVFVRNPWSRLLSLYIYAKSRKEGALARKLSFEEFLRYRIYNNRRFMIQKSYFSNNRGITIVDFIGKFENLENDFKKICKKNKLSCKLLHINKSDHFHYREYYTKATKDLVMSISKEEIKHFGYTF